MFKRFFLGFTVGMAAAHYAITSSMPLLDQLEHWFRGAAANYTSQKSHSAASEVFDHER